MEQERLKLIVDELARQAAHALGYKDYFPTSMPGVTGSYAVWEDASYVPPPKPKHVKSYGPGPPRKRIVVTKRGIRLYHPDYKIDVEVDSTYQTWHVFSAGNISDVELLLKPLWENEESPWNRIEDPWYKDIIRRKGLIQRRWDDLKKPHSTTPKPAQEPDISIPPGLTTRPTFGDLGLRLRPSQKKRLQGKK